MLEPGPPNIPNKRKSVMLLLRGHLHLSEIPYKTKENHESYSTLLAPNIIGWSSIILAWHIRC